MRPLVALLLSCLVGALTTAEPAHADGRLSRARREVSGRSDDERPSSPPPNRPPPARAYEPRPYVRAQPMYLRSPCDPYCVAWGAGSYGPRYADESAPVMPNPPETYASYPYASRHGPYMLAPDLRPWLTNAQRASVPSAAIGQAWAGRVTLDAGYLLGVAHGHAAARLLTPSRFEFAARGGFMYESAQRDSAQVFGLELGLRILQLDAIMLRAFAALQHFDQGGFGQYGGELGVDADLFVSRPWVVSLRASGSRLGETFVSTLRAQVGYLFERYELFVGYQDYRIGEVNLSAPILGTRVWL